MFDISDEKMKEIIKLKSGIFYFVLMQIQANLKD